MTTLPESMGDRTVPQLLRRQAQDRPHVTALVAQEASGETRRISYAELDQLTGQIAAGLQDQGLGRGDRVALLLDNQAGFEAVATLFALHKISAIAVPVNTRYSPAEVRRSLEHCGARAVIHTRTLAATVESVPPTVAEIRMQVGPDAPAEQAWARLLGADPARLDLPEAEDQADWLFTSGTTSRPKCAMFTHAACVATGAGVAEALDLGPGDVLQGSFPFFTSSGCHLVLLASLFAGATLVLEPAFDGEATLRRLREERTSVFIAVPAVYAFLLDNPQFDQSRLPELRLLDYGGAPMPPRDVRRLYERFPQIELRQTYGLTEAGPGGIYLPGEYALSKPGAVGLHAMGMLEFQVVDESARVVTLGEGEIRYRGPSVMSGYFDDDEATREALVGGWLRTGDVVRIDEDGVVFHLDRSKDIIIRGGFNIASVEVESCLMSHPDIREAAVIPIPHPKLGEDVAAVVVPVEGRNPSVEDLQRHCRESLADYKVPRRITFVESLPRNAMGKVLKRDLREARESK